jgi:hypothetical protein
MIGLYCVQLAIATGILVNVLFFVNFEKIETYVGPKKDYTKW